MSDAQTGDGGTQRKKRSLSAGGTKGSFLEEGKIDSGLKCGVDGDISP